MKVRAGGLAVLAAIAVVALTAGSAGAKQAGVRHGHDQRAGVGRLDGQHVRGEERAREDRLQGQHHDDHRGPRLPGDGRRQDGRRSSRTGATSPQWAAVRDKQKTVVDEGPNGVTGVIGWYIPTYLMKQHPEFKTWKGLKGKESLFKSPESGSQGMFLGGDPSYQQKDKTLITALGLNFKFVSVGAEPAQVARWTQLYKQGKPVLFYWYDPQYLNAQYKLSQVQLPARFKGCKDDEKQGGNPKQYACAYPSYTLVKFFSAKFAKSGSPAVAVLKRFKWSNADQNTVAGMIAGQHMDPDKAAQKWIAANKAKVNKWLGK